MSGPTLLQPDGMEPPVSLLVVWWWFISLSTEFDKTLPTMLNWSDECSASLYSINPHRSFCSVLTLASQWDNIYSYGHIYCVEQRWLKTLPSLSVNKGLLNTAPPWGCTQAKAAPWWELIWGAGERVNTDGDLLNSVKCHIPCWVNDSLPPQQGFYSLSRSVWATRIMFKWYSLSPSFQRAHIKQEPIPFLRHTIWRQWSSNNVSSWMMWGPLKVPESISFNIHSSKAGYEGAFVIRPAPTPCFILALYKNCVIRYCFQNLFTCTQAGGTESDSFSTSLHGQQTDLQSCFILGRVYKCGCAFPWAFGNTPTQLCSICIELPSLCLVFLGCRPALAGLKTPLNKSQNVTVIKKTNKQKKSTVIKIIFTLLTTSKHLQRCAISLWNMSHAP